MESNFLTKKRPFLLGITLLFIVSVILFSTNLPGRAVAAEANTVTKRTLNVTGQGTITATPDIAYISLGVITEDANAKVAQQNNAKAMNDVITRIKSSGIKNEDIKTTNYNIYPKSTYNDKTGETKIVGYSVSNSVTVTIRDISKVGNIIDLAAAGGSNISNSISFGLSDYESYYNKALKEAVNIAKKRAATIGESLGIKVGTPVSISESGASSPVIYSGSYNMKAMADAAPTPIQSGSMEIRANVNMTYEY